MDSDFQYCADHLRDHDYGRYISCLFFEPQLRHAAFAIYAFHNRISQISAMVSAPMPGEIRIQWWIDVIKNTAAHCGDPVANALQEVIVEYSLPVDVIERLLQAHIFDLYNDQMNDKEALETYLGETTSSVLLLLSKIADKISQKSSNRDKIELPVSVFYYDACGNGGVFVGIVDLLKMLPLHEYRQQSYFPQELSTYNRVAEISKSDNAQRIDSAWLQEICNYALMHHKAAREAVCQLPVHIRMLFGGLALRRLELDRIARQGLKLGSIYDPPSRLAVIWCLWKANRVLAKNPVGE